jgi:hypothetical protein
MRGPQDDSSTYVDDCTGSELNLELASIWLQDCLSVHAECGTDSICSPILPTRVIHVVNLEESYLLESQGKRGSYLTLSYCWGQGLRLLTTKTSYETFQRRLPMGDHMPLTFREAFKVTLALGYHYIWIDALCIVQDDEHDLQREMTKMGDIYQHSIVTIFAAKRPATDSGLFASRNGPLYKPLNIFVTASGIKEPRKTEVAFVYPHYDYDDPLSKRGWVSE